jgi:hypothetical protein
MYYSARLFIIVSFLLLTLQIQATQAAYPPQYIRSEKVNPASRVHNNRNHDSTKNKMNTNPKNNSFQTVQKVSGSQPVRSSTTTKKYY